jgi:hypothetical protein
MTARHTRRFRPALEALEARFLPSGTTLPPVTAVVESNGTLVVTGNTPTGNSLVIQEVTGKQIRVLNSYNGDNPVAITRANAPANSTPVHAISESSIKGIQVNLGDGKNYVDLGTDGQVRSTYTGPVTVNGGTGSDQLQNFIFNHCTLNGGGGNDTFYAPGTDKTTRFSEPYDANSPALPGPYPAGVGPGHMPAGDDSGSTNYSDIQQGPADNCSILSTLSAVAQANAHQGGTAANDLADGITHTGRCAAGDTYNVKLYNQSGKATEVPVTFNGTWTNKDPYEPQPGEFWTILYSRAYGQLMQKEGLNPGVITNAMQAVTGKSNYTPIDSSNPKTFDPNPSGQAIKTALNQDKPVTVSTYPTADQTPTSSGLRPNHSYTVLNMTGNSQTGYTVTLRDPGGKVSGGTNLYPGTDGEILVPWAKVAKYFEGYTTGKVTGTVLPTPAPSPGSGSNPSPSPAPKITFATGTAGTIDSYTGVGFTENVVAQLAGYVNGSLDTTMSDFHAEVNWGDGSGWESASLAPTMTNGLPFLVKGSHVYTDAGQYSIQIEAIGPGGVTSSAYTTASALVNDLPSGQPGTPPPAPPTSRPPSNVSVSFGTAGAIDTYAGVGFIQNVVASLSGTLNGYTDTTMSDFHAEINWGDGTGWTSASLAPTMTGSGMPFLIKGSHVYADPGTYSIVVYATGPDGTSSSYDTCTAQVSMMPSGQPGTSPPATKAGRALSNVTLSFGTAGTIYTSVGTAFPPTTVASLFGTLNGFTDTTVSDFHAEINWGDGSGWSTGTIARNPSQSGAPFIIQGSHRYSTPGMYPVVVYVTGPDGTSATYDTSTVQVEDSSTGLA